MNAVPTPAGCATCSNATHTLNTALLPSIFNDAIGPVMRGPSSSHCAASVRIGRLARDLMGGDITSVLIEFDPNGSLATTHDGQGSDMGLCGGFLGWDATDARLVDSEKAIREAGIEVDIRISDIQASHPNTYKITLRNDAGEHVLVANSTGGGMIEVIAIDGIPLHIDGDYHETLLVTHDDPDPIIKKLSADSEWDEVILCGLGTPSIIQVKGQRFVSDGTLLDLDVAFENIFHLNPVLPISSRRDMTVPFITVDEMLTHLGKDENQGKALWELAVDYEAERGALERDEVLARMVAIVRLLKQSIKEGVAGTEFEDRILGFQCGKFNDMMNAGELLEGGMLNRMILYVTALMEVKSSMGIIVAAPTAGSCGTLPGTVLAAAEAMELSDEVAAKGLLVGGLIGIFIAAHSSFAAEVGGCQAETGSGAAMAAAALVDMAGGSVRQGLGAASMALQNCLGLICDPVANRVEVPCLGRNINGAANAFTSANVSLADFAEVIPLDEVIATHNDVGRNLPSSLRCTCLGGLSITRSAKAVEAKLSLLGEP